MSFPQSLPKRAHYCDSLTGSPSEREKLKLQFEGEVLLKETVWRGVAPLSETELKKQAYSSLQELELALNTLVQRQLSKLTSGWWKQTKNEVQSTLRAKLRGQKDRDHKNRRVFRHQFAELAIIARDLWSICTISAQKRLLTTKGLESSVNRCTVFLI